MLLLPANIIALLSSFAPLFSRRTWRHMPIAAGAILALGRRMVCSALRAVGPGQLRSQLRSQLRTFQTYHCALNRASWSGLGASRSLLGRLVATLASTGPPVVGIDETIERRRRLPDEREKQAGDRWDGQWQQFYERCTLSGAWPQQRL